MIPHHLKRKLEDTLGADAAEDLVSELNEGRSVRADLAEFRHEMQLSLARIDAQFGRLDAKVETQFGRLEAKLDTQITRVDGRIDEVAARLDGKIDTQVAYLAGKIDAIPPLIVSTVEASTARLLKWSFVFWVGAVGAIAALAGVLK